MIFNYFHDVAMTLIGLSSSYHISELNNIHVCRTEMNSDDDENYGVVD